MTNLSDHNQAIARELDPDLALVMDDVAAEVAYHMVQGLRTKAQQAANVASGASQTSNSYHLPDATGRARAVDVAALVNGAIAWGPEPLYYAIAEAVRRHAIARKVPIRWGGCWQLLNKIPPGTTCGQAVTDYVSERRMLKQKPFLDLGHFEIRKDLVLP